MIRYQKPRSFYDTFERKSAGSKVTHYCPGCGHGTVQKLIAEAIDQLGIQDRVIFHSPVGCSVFAYYYYDTGNIQCSHGRAPAVATGVRRTLDDAILISYQGDGDLAGIGMAEIMHAANRGENLTVFFINNAIYGMTGGQMAPTTLLGQKTATTPLGREHERDGDPIGMCEVMDALQAPVYIERVSLSTPAGVMKTRKAVRRGLKNQMEQRGFSFIEVLSPCPINWKMSPLDARNWIAGTLEKKYPPGRFRNRLEQRVPAARLETLEDRELIGLLQGRSVLPSCPRGSEDLAQQRIKIAGFGGQGVLSAGILLAQCGISEGLEAAWLPSYGPEMRGGHANASVTISVERIGSPVVDRPNVLIAMNGPSLREFEGTVEPGGWIFINSSIVKELPSREDVHIFSIPATDIAREANLLAAANVVMVTAYLCLTGRLSLETLLQVIPISVKNKKYIDVNLSLVERTISYCTQETGR